METQRICPNCRKPLPPDVPLGLCPECLVKSGFPTGTEPGAAGEAGRERFVPPPVEEIAQLFPQLEILGFIGKGGMGAVFKARQPALDRFVALKVLPPAVAGDPGFAERFNREARALARLNHPNIVAVHDFGKAGNLHYLLMEYVDGANLREIERAGKLSPEQALAIVPQICEALQFAHNEGIVHRDIKPENLLLDKKGRLKITDFGIAKIVGVPAGQVSLTGLKDVIGTPHYMAPEQIEKPQTVDHRADIYSLGVVFYEMLTGELPLGKFQPPSRKVQIDVRLDEVVLHALEKEPERRYQQASEVKTRVETIARTPATAGAAPDVAVFTQTALARDYQLNIGQCLSRGWHLVFNNFWPIVGVVALIGLLQHAANSTLIGIVVGGPLSGGLWLFLLKKIRGEQADVGTAFSGFSVAFVPLFLGGLVTFILVLAGFVCFLLPGIYMGVAWVFTLMLIADTGLDFWPAMELSRKVVSKHWWKFLWFLIVLAAIELAGILLCIIGFFVAAPIALAALAYAYEDVFRPAARAARDEPAGVRVEPQRSGGGWETAVGIIAGAVAAVLLVAFFGLLAAIAIPSFIKGRHHAQQVAAEHWTQQGWQLWQAHKLDEAAAKFRQAVELRPDDAEAWNGLGWATFNAGKSEEAEKAFQKAISFDPNQPGALNGLGQIYLSQRKYDQAETYLLKAAPKAPAAWYGLARLYLLEGKFEQAEKYAQNIVDSGQADEVAKKMLEAAKQKHLSEGLRMMIEPPPAGPAKEGAASSEEDLKLAKQPPVVVETFPVSGAREVEPGETEIRVRFSKPMADGSWSWSTVWKDSTPESVGPPHYLADHRTCVMKVRLKSNRTYAWWLNSEKSHHFQDETGQPAVPYLLIFHTKGTASSSPNSNSEDASDTRPRVVSVSPANGATDVDLNQVLRIRFNRTVDPNKLAVGWSSGSFLANGWPRYESDRNEFVIPVRLIPGQTNELVVQARSAGTSGLHRANFTPTREYRWHFTTAPLTPKAGAARPKVIRISPRPGCNWPVLVFLKIAFDQPMLSSDESPPYLRRTRWGSVNLPTLVASFGYEPSSDCFTTPVVLPPLSKTNVTFALEGFTSADGIASDPVVISCNTGTNYYSTEELKRVTAAAKDPRLENLLGAMKAARARLTSAVEKVAWVSPDVESQTKDYFRGISIRSATFKWQGTNQVYADISDVMAVNAVRDTNSFLLGSDGKMCWRYSYDL